jgi:site-specific DNA-methyltransferase (adenine-specific)
MNSKKYQVIYADPPWRYDFSKSDSRQIENQYPTMSVEDICALNIPSDENAVLYLWATAPKLLEALAVMKAWGFVYKTQAIWNKKLLGMGYWFRGQHEILLVGTRGKVSPPSHSLRVGSVFSIARNKHSKKPDEISKLIAAWFPHATKVELFARAQSEGWDVWGNEVDSDIQLVA